MNVVIVGAGLVGTTLAEKLSRDGHDVSITPDGPRGPAYVMKPGAVLAARRVQSRVLLVGIAYGRSWRMKSWDRFFLPVPFSTVTMQCELVSHDEIPPGQVGVELLQNRLRALTGDPDLEEMETRHKVAGILRALTGEVTRG